MKLDQDDNKESLEQLYKERETVRRQIERLDTDSKIYDLRIKFKESVESKLQKLCTADEFTKSSNQIQATVDTLQ